MKIYLDPACDILYSSYYIEGLVQYFGEDNVRFTSTYFSEFVPNNHFLAFVIESQDSLKKIIIDFSDSEDTHPNALNWCDTYAKINVSNKDYASAEKILTIGPGFGIQLYSPSRTRLLALSNYLKSRDRIPNKEVFFANYKSLLNRMKLEEYFPNVNQDNYIFFAASLWENEQNTNDFRANFIKACKEIKEIKFDGGFAPRPTNDIRGYEDLTVTTRYTMDEYISNMKKSLISFNTPAVLDCHGWKLGEFLCFGKVIISTPLSRKVPKELKDSVHLLFTDGTQADIKEKIKTLLANKPLMNEIKANARKYFENELSPKRVIERVHNFTYFRSN